MFSRVLQGSIRKKLAMLFVLSALPGLGYIAFSALDMRHAATADALEDLRGFTNQLADAQDRTTRNAKMTLENLARLPEVRQGDAVACSTLFATMVKVNPQYGELQLLDASGNPLAGSSPESTKNFASLKLFRDALGARAFVSGEHLQQGGLDQPAIAFACPVFGELGEVAGVLMGTVLLDSYGRQFDLRRLPKQSYVGVCDRNGMLLLRYPADQEAVVGSPVGQRLAQALNSTEEGLVMEPDGGGGEVAVSFRQLRLEGAAEPYMYVFAGSPLQTALKAGQEGVLRSAVVLLFSLGLALAVAWGMGGKTVVRRLEELAEGAIRVGLGDYSVRVCVDPEVAEIDTLARTFNGMAEALAGVSAQRAESELLLALLAERLRNMAALGRGVHYSLREYGGSTYLDWLEGQVEALAGCSRLEILEAGGFAHLIAPESAGLYEEHVAGLPPGSRGECELVLVHPDGTETRVRSVAVCVGVADPTRPTRRCVYGLLEPLEPAAPCAA